MPFTKQQNHRIFITALVLSFLLIAGSIYLHLKQKHHLGRLSFNFDSDVVKPTDGVDYIEEFDGDLENQTEFSDKVIDYMYKSEEYKRAEDDDNVSDTILTQNCIDCLCMTVNECKTTYCRQGEKCGLFRISIFYWKDGGKPKLDIDDYYPESAETEEMEYFNCINDKNCAVQTINNYVKRFKRDCNKDGVIDCRDFIALHLLGPSGCTARNISLTHAMRMNNCKGI